MARAAWLRGTSVAICLTLLAACSGGDATQPPASPVGSTPTGRAPTARGGESPDATQPAAAPSPTATADAASSPPPPPSPRRPTALAWAELTASGATPSAREDHTWTPDAGGEVAYLFGGRAGSNEFGDLWRYDLAADSWTQLEPEGSAPAPRFGHTALWLDGYGLVIWSGQAGPRFFADVWAYDSAANSWRELPSTGDVPPARYGSCAALGPDGRMWISHGFTEDTGRFSDTRAYDFASGSWQDLTLQGSRPVERCLHDCLWTPAGELLIYAGQTTGAPAIGDMWLYDHSAAAWAQAQTPKPEPRQLYALAQLNGVAFVFGGGTSTGDELDDLWQLDLAGVSWSEASPSGASPPARRGATLVADAERSRLLVFGGISGADALDDLWQLELSR